MKNNYKFPLAVYVLFHSGFAEGEKYFDMIYQLLCRDVERPLSDGIDIPVYLRTDSGDDTHIPQIDFSQSDKTAIIILIDEKMFCSLIWRKYIGWIVKNVSKRIKIYSIELCQYAFEITSATKKIQGINLNTFSFKENWTLIQTRLLENLYRLIIQSDQKVSLFISHAKKDGELEAKKFRDYLRGNSKLNSFFDENDILDGNDFTKQIESNLKNNLLLIFKTDNYSEREWCRKEILIAKENDIPTVIINNMKHKERRVFPYMGNCPMLCYNEDYSESIIVLLKVALNQEFQKKFLAKIKQMSNNIDCIIPHYPELFSFLSINKRKKQNVVYPEPPLGTEEQTILKKFDSKIKFLTPAEAFIATSRKSLDNIKIAVSVSESDDMQKYGCSKTLLKDTVLELSRYLLKAGAGLVYGGDLRKDGFTEAFEDFSYYYGKKENSDKTIKYFSNYFAWPIYLTITESQKADFIHKRVEPVFVDPPKNCKNPKKFLVPCGNENCLIWANSLTKMRKEMEKNVDARIIIGGTLSNFKGRYAGIIEEFIIAAQKKHPIYLIGGFGGASKAIANKMQQGSFDLYKEALKGASYEDFINYYNLNNPKNKINYKKITSIIKNYKFDNGLTDIENKQLWKSNNVIEIVALVLKGLLSKIGV